MKMASEKRAMDKIFRRRDRYDIPDWQLQEVWNRCMKLGSVLPLLLAPRCSICHFPRER